MKNFLYLFWAFLSCLFAVSSVIDLVQVAEGTSGFLPWIIDSVLTVLFAALAWWVQPPEDEQ